MTDLIESRLNLHQKRVDVIDHMRRNFNIANWPGWPGGERQYKKDYDERMVLKGIIQELKYILESEQ